MKSLSNILALAALTLGSPGPALAYDLYEQLGTNADLSVGVPGDVQVTAGLSFGIPLPSIFSVETGFAYIIRDQGFYTFYTFRIPIIARAWVFKDLSVGAGGYYAHAFGGAQVNGGPALGGGTPPGFLDYSFLQLAQDDFGLIGSVSYRFFHMQYLTFLVEGRYIFGLTQLDRSGLTNLQTRSLELTLVVDFAI